MEENELAAVLEAVVIRDSLMLYMNQLTAQHRKHPDFEATMRFIAGIYKKFARIADQKVVRDDFGNYKIRRNLRTDFDLN